MNIKKYLKVDCIWEAEAPKDRPYGQEYLEPKQIKCLFYSSGEYLASGFKVLPDEIVNKSSRVYMVNELGVKKGDYLDGMIVKYVAEIPNRKGQIILKICSVK